MDSPCRGFVSPRMHTPQLLLENRIEGPAVRRCIHTLLFFSVAGEGLVQLDLFLFLHLPRPIRSPDTGADFGKQQLKVDGFCQIVVGATFETRQYLLVSRKGAEKNERHVSHLFMSPPHLGQ